MKAKFLSRWTFILAVILLLIPVIWQAAMIHLYARNVPLGDDYDLVYNFLTRVRHHHHQLLQNLIAQHNEHRILVPRLIIYIIHKIQGAPNLITLIIIGNMFLIGILTIIILNLKQTDIPWYFGIPAAYMVFSPMHATQMIWVTGALQNFGVVFFAAAGFYLYASNRPNKRCRGLLFGCMAAFTSLNGLLVPLLMLFRSLIASPVSQHPLSGTAPSPQNPDTDDPPPAKLLWILVSAGVSIACLGTYFFNYTHPSHHPPLNWSLHHIPETFCHFLILLGGMLLQPLASWIFGCIMVLIVCVLLFRRAWQIAPFEFDMLLFLIGSAAMISLGRTRFGMGQALCNRYAILYLLIPVFVYLILIRTISRWRNRWLVAGLMVVLVTGATIRNYNVCMNAVRKQSYDLYQGIHDWARTGSAPGYPLPECAGDALDHMVSNGLYRPPTGVSRTQWMLRISREHAARLFNPDDPQYQFRRFNPEQLVMCTR